jgi:hypothetical protein
LLGSVRDVLAIFRDILLILVLLGVIVLGFGAASALKDIGNGGLQPSTQKLYDSRPQPCLANPGAIGCGR